MDDCLFTFLGRISLKLEANRSVPRWTLFRQLCGPGLMQSRCSWMSLKHYSDQVDRRPERSLYSFVPSQIPVVPLCTGHCSGSEVLESEREARPAALGLTP